MTKTTETPAAAAAQPIVVFGVDENNKPRAARFTGANPDLVAKAAQAMGLRVQDVVAPPVAEVAKKLPAGRLYANGKGFVPYIRRDLYNKLVEATGGEPNPGPESTAVPAGLPRTWDEMAAGHLVIAQESLEYGWWEAIVVERVGDMLTLRWRDYRKYPNFTRHVSAVALLQPPSDASAA